MLDFNAFRSDNERAQKNGWFIKDFDGWNTEKKATERSKWLSYRPRNPKPRELWLTYFWHNIGKEVCGKEEFQRPVIVIKRLGDVCIVCPLTTKWKDDQYHFTMHQSKVETSRVKISHITTFSIERFIKKLPDQVMEDAEFDLMLQKISTLTGIWNKNIH